MKKFFSIFLTFMFASTFLKAQESKLIVGIVVDQMRYDYLHRYYDQYSDGGFKRLMNMGFLCRNAHYNYVPTETGPGHASVYTGTTPSVHGIVANVWMENGERIYCAGDSTQKVVGSESGYGEISPRNLFTTTLGDQMKLASSQQSKVYGISIKDRGAVLPAGHAADGAFWYDSNSGKFVSSTYYGESLPTWVEAFNAMKLADNYLEQTWETLLPIEEYTASHGDVNEYERTLPGMKEAAFPYDFKQIVKDLKKSQMKRSPYGLLPSTPYGNTIVRKLAEAALTNEQMGKDKYPDLLAISFSSPDYAGHAFGPQSIEIQDMYLRLDLEIAELLKTLDTEVGFGNYTLFLTADHGVAQIPKYSQELKLPGGYIDGNGCVGALETYLNTLFGSELWVLGGGSEGIYLNRDMIIQKNLSIEEFQEEAITFLRDCEGVYDAYSAEDMQEEEYQTGIRSLIQNGYYWKRSADVIVVAKPGWLSESYKSGGTGHGAPFRYDTHVPVILYGNGIPKGSTVREVFITDIIPSISMLLNLQLPSGSSTRMIEELFEE